MPLDNVTLLRISSQAFIYVNVISFLYSIFQFERSKSKLYDFIVLLFIVYAVILSQVVSTDIMQPYIFFIKLLSYMSIMLSIYYLDYIKIDKTIVNMVFTISITTGIWFIYLSLTEFAYKGHPISLTLGYDNPNQTAIFLLFNIIILIAACNYYGNKLMKLFLFIMSLYLSYLIYLTESRACFIVLILFFVFNFKKTHFGIPKIAVFFITLTPILFMIIYTGLYINGFFLDFELMGKPFYTNREVMIMSVLEDLKNHMLLGKLGEYRFSNTHNGVLSIIASLGLVGLGLYYLYLLRILFRASQRLKNKTALIAFCGILMIFVQSSAESALMISGSIYGAAVSILYLLTRIEDSAYYKT